MRLQSLKRKCQGPDSWFRQQEPEANFAPSFVRQDWRGSNRLREEDGGKEITPSVKILIAIAETRGLPDHGGDYSASIFVPRKHILLALKGAVTH